MAPATYTAPEFAGLLGVSEWALRQAVRAGTSPVPPIYCGRRYVFAKAAVDALLGLNQVATGHRRDEHRSHQTLSANITSTEQD